MRRDNIQAQENVIDIGYEDPDANRKLIEVVKQLYYEVVDLRKKIVSLEQKVNE